jgi:hypothetical protein
MKTFFTNTLLFILTALSLCAQETVQITERIDLSDKIEKNDVVVPLFSEFDTDGRYIYIPEVQTSTILKIEIASGKLIKTISRLGEGPGEIIYPGVIVVRNDKIFVDDQKSRKIKIFSCTGEFKNEIFTGSGVRGLDVSRNEEIFVFANPIGNKYCISVYDLLGNKKRSLIETPAVVLEQYIKEKFSKWVSSISGMRVDRYGNEYVVHGGETFELAKHDHLGKILWKESFNTNLLPAYKEFVSEIKSRGISFVNPVGSCEMTPLGNIAIYLSGGIIIFDSTGKKKTIIKFPDKIYEKGKIINLKPSPGLIRFIDSRTFIFLDADLKFYIYKTNKEV